MRTCTARCSTAGPDSDGRGETMPSREERGVARTSSVTVSTLKFARLNIRLSACQPNAMSMTIISRGLSALALLIIPGLESDQLPARGTDGRVHFQRARVRCAAARQGRCVNAALPALTREQDETNPWQGYLLVRTTAQFTSGSSHVSATCITGARSSNATPQATRRLA